MNNNNVRIVRGTITDATASPGKLIRCSVMGIEDEEIDDVELFGDHGSSAVPDDDSECIAVQFGHRTIVIAGADRRIAPSMSKGDVAIHTDANQYIIIKKTGGIDIRTSGVVTVYAAQIKLGDDTLLPVVNGVVTPECACSYAGKHVQGSATVMAKG
ncbi:MAG: phage baseplate assembly protein [Candidatus Paceibacterota bacterium]|jgi:phage gp45-like